MLEVSGQGNIPLVVLLSLAAAAVMAVLGHLDLKYGIAERETSLHNRYNPEIQELLRKK